MSKNDEAAELRAKLMKVLNGQGDIDEKDFSWLCDSVREMVYRTNEKYQFNILAGESTDLTRKQEKELLQNLILLTQRVSRSLLKHI